MQWIKDGITLDETRVSTIIIIILITHVIAFIQVFMFGEISNNVLMLIAYQLAAFTGIKITEAIVEPTKPKKDDYSKLP